MSGIGKKHRLMDDQLSPVEATPLKADILKQANGLNFTVPDVKPDVTQQLDVVENGAGSPDREGWDSKVQFLLSVIAYAVGLGNVWRFPYLCQQNGGGAFLIPYFIMLAIEGVPLCVLELGIGQRLRLGSIGVWNKIHPYLGGLGIASAIVAFLVGMYYTSIIGWCFFYFLSSFRTELQWAECPLVPGTNDTIEPECARTSPTSYFWYREALNISSGVDDFGGIQWKLAGCLALSWITIWACMARGIENSGKIMYFTAGFPYLVLLIFFGRAITLRGSSQGIMHLITPQMDKLQDPIVWLDAATQIFYSLGLGFGSLIAFGSYNPTNNNFVKDAVIVSLTNAFTGIFASLVVFAVLGFKAALGVENCACRFLADIGPTLGTVPWPATEFPNIIKTPELCVEYYNLLEANSATYGLSQELFTNATCTSSKFLNEVSEGTGLAFIVFTEVMVQLPGGPFWSVIFFMMLLALGMGSMFGNVAGIQASLADLKLLPWRKEVMAAISCTISFLIGLIFVSRAGMYWVGLFDGFVGSFSLLIIALLEMVGVCWIFKYSRFAADVKDMTGQTLSWYWSITLRFVAPALIVIVLGASIAMRIIKGVSYWTYNSEDGVMHATPYPPWAQAVCALLVIVGIGPIIAIAVFRMIGLIKYEPDPSLVNAGFNTSASTTMFVRNQTENGLDDMESEPRSYGTYLFPTATGASDFR